MIECKKVSFSYPPNETDIGDREGHGTLRNIDLSINDGDFVLLCGTSGCGKTTLTRLFNGLIPHYYDGKLEGTVMLDGEDMENDEPDDGDYAHNATGGSSCRPSAGTEWKYFPRRACNGDYSFPQHCWAVDESNHFH